ncbi:hypothetical protein MAM1_0088d04818 [Mucor ambiguus]|uniref:Uncharacterized protein n=1 Tax=Mucor ambiguus TaxID=91626 RepID=A0A0C9MTG0_9FUNG|nr:hypothetical protein MAM1_0088d04818 [Mucor ambiguus]
MSFVRVNLLCLNDALQYAYQVDSFTRVVSYLVLWLSTTRNKFLKLIAKKAGTDCCAVTGTVAAKEDDAVVTTVGTLVSQTIAPLPPIVMKEPLGYCPGQERRQELGYSKQDVRHLSQ